MKHRIVYRSLIERIRSGEFYPGARLPTEVELVKEFNVSRPTIARAMRDLQTEGLVERRAGDGSYVLDPPSSSTDTMLGVLLPELGCGDIFDAICAQVTRSARKTDLSVILGDIGSFDYRTAKGRLDVSADDALAAAEFLIARGVSGVVFAPLSRHGDDRDINANIIDKLRSASIQIVLLDRDVRLFPDRSDFDLVSVDHLRGQYLATELILSAGCTRPAYLKWPGSSDSIRKRVAGFKAAIHDGGLAEGAVLRGDPLDVEFIKKSLEESRADAVLCENDLIATQLLQTLAKLEIEVPNDLAIVGFNNNDMAQYMSTPLTTVAQPCEQIGDTVVEVIQQRIDSPNGPPKSVLLPPRLVVRESCPAAKL